MPSEIYLYDRSLAGTNSNLSAPDRLIALSPAPTHGPLVTCVMVTRGELPFVRSALAAFNRQTYTNRELLLVCDAPRAELEQLAADAGDSVRLATSAPDLPLGTLRNIGVEQARGEIICQWDDDDLYGPNRIANGVAGLLQADADALFLRQWLVWSPGQRTLSLSSPRIWEGSMLARKRSLLPYPGTRRGEDTAMVDLLLKQRRVALLDAPLDYCYCIHGANTFNGPHLQHIVDTARLKFDYAKALAAFAPDLDFAAHPAMRDVAPAAIADRSQARKLQAYLAINRFFRRLKRR